MEYAIIIYEDDKDFERRSGEDQQAYWSAYSAYTQALREANILRGGSILHSPQLATKVSFRDGKRMVQDGPYAETKEQLGGFFLIEVPDLDEALKWAARCPCTDRGFAEVRPVLPQ